MKHALTLIAATLYLAACATQPDPAMHQAPGGFIGFFHGFIALPSLVSSLFLPIRIYEFPNSGFGYDFGFVAGFCSSLLGVFLSLMACVGGMVT
jgi:hypothetical protein